MPSLCNPPTLVAIPGWPPPLAGPRTSAPGCWAEMPLEAWEVFDASSELLVSELALTQRQIPAARGADHTRYAHTHSGSQPGWKADVRMQGPPWMPVLTAVSAHLEPMP